MDPKHVKAAVLYGGDSAEREISLLSGRGVLQALRRRGWQISPVEIQSYDGLPQRLRGHDVAFIALHGGSGEDGTVQLLLELVGAAYVGSDPVSSARAMDKVESHQRLYGAGLYTPEWQLITADSARHKMVPEGVRALGTPAVVKPRREGSSFGLHMVDHPAQLSCAVEETGTRYGDVLVERYIPGRELTVAVLEQDGEPCALPVVELIPAGDMFDYAAKYSPGHCRFVCPAALCPTEERAVKHAAVEAHRALGCRDLSRTDIRLGQDGTPFVLEVNTLPGLTEMSTFPRAAAEAGIPYDELLERLLLNAISRLPEPFALG